MVEESFSCRTQGNFLAFEIIECTVDWMIPEKSSLMSVCSWPEVSLSLAMSHLLSITMEKLRA